MNRWLTILLLIVGVFAQDTDTLNTAPMGDLEKQMLYKQNDVSPLIAGLCALTPTMGHLYVGKWKRINPFSALVISPAISIILLMPNKTLKKERTIISNTLIVPKISWYFLQIQDAIYLAHQHNANLNKEIYGKEYIRSPKKSIIQKWIDKKEAKKDSTS